MRKPFWRVARSRVANKLEVNIKLGDKKVRDPVISLSQTGDNCMQAGREGMLERLLSLPAYSYLKLLLSLGCLLVLSDNFLLDVGRNFFILVEFHLEGASALGD